MAPLLGDAEYTQFMCIVGHNPYHRMGCARLIIVLFVLLQFAFLLANALYLFAGFLNAFPLSFFFLSTLSLAPVYMPSTSQCLGICIGSYLIAVTGSH